MRGFTFSLFCVFVVLLTACQDRQNNPTKTNQAQLKESLEKANRYLVNDEEEDINNYVARHKLDMVATGTGLRYKILQAGTGDSIREGQVVTMDYELRDIKGDLIYSSKNEGVKSFVVGHGDVESGMDEAVRHLHKGDVAVVIIPSHLGYGLLGDQKSIPERSTLVYTLRINEVNENN